MPRASGVYSLPPGYLAVTGQTIQASQHNPPLEDIAAALTASLPRDGSAAMTAPIKLPDGTSSAPAVTFASEPTLGLYRKAAGVVAVVGGLLIGGRFIGELIPWTRLTAPALTVLPFGQTLSRTTYADLWTVAQAEIAAGNLFYNTGNGSTTFGIGDCRGFVLAGKDNMGGTAASRLTLAVSGVDGTKLGWGAGDQSVALTAAQLPAHTHSGTTGAMNANASHSHGVSGGTYGGNQAYFGGQQGTSFNVPINGAAISIDAANTDHGHPFTTDGGSGLAGTAHANVQPTMVVNFILYAGA